ncbi:multidrug effflux MFS transporter [Rhizobium sp. FKL33]|uniref:multidrug effflux MFS transporter n=1 Tax=Rhizobium sp. FKL33 TaxID=2562307 RepID=UPI0010C1089D|nr:multidrug effflux MFS transporter [Rhizobium sp. FKL33]
MHDVSMPEGATAPGHQLKLGMAEFIAMAASLAAVAAMSIDILLPALPAIGQTFGVADPNSRQLVILIYVVTFSMSQLFFGLLTDRYGRRPFLIFGLALYLAGSVAAMFSTSFEMLLAMRVVQGVGTAALQVVVMAVIRDCFSGQAMGRVLTFVFTTFMIVPIIAPSIGQMIQYASGWRGVFLFNTVAALALFAWVYLRLEETLAHEAKRALSFANLFEALKAIATNRITAGYAVASMATFIGLFGYVVSVQQVYGELYGLGEFFALAFGASSIGVAAAALGSARLVRLFGIRAVAHSAMLLFTASGLTLAALSLVAVPPFWVSFLFLSICMMAFGVLQGNFNAMALEPQGHIAGVASSLYGVVTMTVGSIGGGLVGQAYDGTPTPLALAFGLGGLVASLAVLWTRKGRLFRAIGPTV